METLTTDTTHTQTDRRETDPDQITMAEVTPARVSAGSVCLKETMESRVGPSSNRGAKSPAGPTGTDRLLLTETESLGTGTRSRGSAGIKPVTTGQSPATCHVTAALSLPGRRGLSPGPTSAPQTCR